MHEPADDSSSKAPAAPAAPAPLPYAPSLARDHFSVERGTNYLRVISPPINSWRRISRWYHAAITLLGLLITQWLLFAVTGATAEQRQSAAIAMLTHGGVLLLVLAFAYDRVRRSFVFELTDRTLTLTRLGPWGGHSPRTWRRDAITSVDVTKTGNLGIRVSGEERADVALGPDLATAERVAAALREGLAAPAGPVLPPAHAQPGEIVPPGALPSGPARTALVATALALSLTGVTLAIFVNMYVALAPFALAAIPAGLALGTQKKDFYP